ncbi:MAG: hypothetical protein V1659_03705 [Candidatus Woesearchaeota archaeon]
MKSKKTISSEEQLMDSLNCDELCLLNAKGKKKLTEGKLKDKGCRSCFDEN